MNIQLLLGNRELDETGTYFFSKKNKEFIYMKIQNIVFNKINYRINYTGYNSLENIMVTVYMSEYCNRNINNDFLKILNDTCINKTVDIIINNISFYKYYIKDISYKNRFMENPKYLGKNKELGDISSKIII